MKSAGLLTFALLVSSLSIAQNYKVIHSFAGYPNDGLSPVSSVVFDKAGNMYGTTPGGGNQTGCGDLGCGVAYELSPNGQGNWTETILYNFCQDFDGLSCLDGSNPTNITIDGAGNLYGTTFNGGKGESGSGGGIAFELSPPNKLGAIWTESVLYNFCSQLENGTCVDGWVGFVGPLVLDRAGNLYGTTALGGAGHVAGGKGLVFELSQAQGGWEEMILHNFCTEGQGDECPDGYEPGGGVTFDKSGNLYGTAAYSGNINLLGGGILFRLSVAGTGWKYKQLAKIPDNTQPSVPETPIGFDDAGNLYGTLSRIDGGVFQMNMNTGKFRLLAFNGKDGGGPAGGLYVDSKSSVLYGTTAAGGANGVGTLYAIDENGHETVLYSFCQLKNCADGESPGGTLAHSFEGNLYGTAEFGGEYGPGVVFEITP